MKKIVFLSVILLAVMGCKQKSATEATEGKDTIAKDTVAADSSATVQSFAKIDNLDCSYYLAIRGLSAEEQLRWLSSHAQTICGNDDYLKCLVKQHTITKAVYDTAITDFWGTTAPVNSTFDYSEFSGEECSFLKYYAFKPDASHVITHQLKVFDITAHNYSIPFFKGIPVAFPTVTATQDLIFTEAKINGQNVIVFKIDGVADAYFDYSKFPCGSI